MTGDALGLARMHLQNRAWIDGADPAGWDMRNQLLAALVAEIDAAPVVQIKRGLTGRGLIVCETDLEPGRVRLLAEDK